MDGNTFCKLHTQYLIDEGTKYETVPHRNIYAEKLGSIDTTEPESNETLGNVCLNCGKPTKNRRNYCNKTCAAEYKRKDAEIGQCAWCGTDFPKWPVNKVTCSVRCSQLQYKNKDAERYQKIKRGLI